MSRSSSECSCVNCFTPTKKTKEQKSQTDRSCSKSSSTIDRRIVMQKTRVPVHINATIYPEVLIPVEVTLKKPRNAKMEKH